VEQRADSELVTQARAGDRQAFNVLVEHYERLARLRTGEGVRELDCRPSDALALAQRLDAPIYVADEILASMGMDVPPEWRALSDRLAEQLEAGPGFRHPMDLLREMGEKLGGGIWSLVRVYSV